MPAVRNKQQTYVKLEPELVRQIEDFRFANRFPARVDAIDQLLRAGIAAVADRSNPSQSQT
jgi:hypothetical protein